MERAKDFQTTFTNSYNNMVATSENSYGWSNHIFHYRVAVKRYSPEDIKKILDSGSLEAKIRLSRYYFSKGGFYQRILLHYATLLKYVGLLIPNPVFGKDLSETFIQKKYLKTKFGLKCCLRFFYELFINN